MAERFVHVYRVTEVAEYQVEDDGIYEDEVDMLRDVIRAAEEGVLEFEASPDDFVVMTWDEESRMTARAVGHSETQIRHGGTDAIPGPVNYCEVCLGKQYETPSGTTCRNDHGGAGSLQIEEVLAERARRQRLLHEPNERVTPRVKSQPRSRPGGPRRSS